MHGVFVDANESLAVIFERLEKPGDPRSGSNRDPDITSDRTQNCSTAPPS